MGLHFMEIVVLAQVSATLAMVGVIWFAQVVHYPLLGRVEGSAFRDYQLANMRKTGWVVAPLMLVESLSAFLLLWHQPEGIHKVQAWIGAALLVVIWLSTAFFQVPMHKTLIPGFDSKAHHNLVRTNWIRTVAWSARGFLMSWMLTGLMR